MKEERQERFKVFLKEKGFKACTIEAYLLLIQLFEIWLVIEDLEEKKVQIDLFNLWLIMENLELKLKESVQKKLNP